MSLVFTSPFVSPIPIYNDNVCPYLKLDLDYVKLVHSSGKIQLDTYFPTRLSKMLWLSIIMQFGHLSHFKSEVDSVKSKVSSLNTI